MRAPVGAQKGAPVLCPGWGKCLVNQVNTVEIIPPQFSGVLTLVLPRFWGVPISTPRKQGGTKVSTRGNKVSTPLFLGGTKKYPLNLVPPKI